MWFKPTPSPTVDIHNKPEPIVKEIQLTPAAFMDIMAARAELKDVVILVLQDMACTGLMQGAGVHIHHSNEAMGVMETEMVLQQAHGNH
jgi:hypothetical protein